MVAKSSNKNSFIPSGKLEYVKQYVVYDVSGRMTHLYECPANTLNGEPCLLTRYEYDGSSTRVQKRKELESVWDSSWEIA